MTNLEIIKVNAYNVIGYIGNILVRERLLASNDNLGFMLKLDNLEENIIKAIVERVYKTNGPDKQTNIRILIPTSIVKSITLPDECLSNENPAGIRNINFGDNRPILTATADYLSDTMGNISSLTRDDIKNADMHLWLEACKEVCNLNLAKNDEDIFTASLGALLESNSELGLTDFANFCSSICFYIYKDGLDIRRAVGFSLPRIRLPKDIEFFNNNRFGKSKTNWKKYFLKLRDRERIYTRQDKSGRVFEKSFLEDNYKECLANNIVFTDEAEEAVKKYINASDNDYDKSRSLFECDWEKDNIKKLFDAVKVKQLGLGDESINYFSTEFEKEVCNQLSQEEVDFLKKLNGKIDKDDKLEIREFFERHKHDLSQNIPLYKRWEKVVFDKKTECSDLYHGLIEVFTNNIASRIQPEDGFYVEITVAGSKREWLKKNYNIARFFSLMYKPLFSQFNRSGLIRWKHSFKDKGSTSSPAFDYVKFFDEQSANVTENGGKKTSRSSSESKDNRTIKFDIRIMNKNGTKADNAQYQLFWRMDKHNIGYELYSDLTRIVNNGNEPLLSTKVYRQPVDKKGGIHYVSLNDINTLDLKSSEGRGRLLVKNSDFINISSELRFCIDKSSFLDANHDKKESLLKALSEFESSYKNCIQEFLDNGLNYDLALAQANDFKKLLLLCNNIFNAKSEKDEFLSLLLMVGTVCVEDENTKIAAPWHPERLKSLAIRQQRIINYCINIVSYSTEFIRKELFNKSCIDELNATISPEILFSQSDSTNVLVSKSSVNGYTLYEEPIDLSSSCKFYSDLNAAKATKDIIEFIVSYLKLYPHLKNNLNIVLYECNIAELAFMLVNNMSLSEDLADVKLNLVLMSTQYDKLDHLYRDLLNRIDENQYDVSNRERNDVFLSNLRVSVLIFDDNSKYNCDIKPYDICILYDAFESHADLGWKQSLFHMCVKNDVAYAPHETSYRYVNPKEDKLSSIYLVSPLQAETTKVYVQAICSYAGVCSIGNDPSLLPVKTINLEKDYFKRLINMSHDMADWVVSFDRLLEKRLLENAGIEVVRYRKDRINGRNIVISSTSALSSINKILSELVKGLIGSDYFDSSVLTKIKEDALILSGNVLLRASKSYIFTYEMLGLILSKKLLDSKFEEEKALGRENTVVAYFMLDDYVSWFPTDDNKIADILAIAVSIHNGRYHVSIKIAESKFIGSCRSEHKDKSYRQLRSTLNTFIKAFFDQESNPVDRRQWYFRLAELILDAKIKKINDLDILNKARTAIIDDNFSISISGASLIFDYSQESVDELGTDIEVAKVNLYGNYNECVHAHQLVFGRDKVIELFNSYVQDKGIERILSVESGDCNYSNIDNLFKEKDIRDRKLNLEEFDLFAFDSTKNVNSLEERFDEVKETTVTEEENVKNSDLNFKEFPNEETCNVNKNTMNPSVSLQTDAKAINIKEHKAAIQQDNLMDNCSAGFLSIDKNWPKHIAALIEKHANNQASIEEKKEKFKEAQRIADALCSALRSYNCIAKHEGVRVTPNGVAVTLQGNDSLTVDKILKQKLNLFTTYKLNVSTVVPQPGKIVVNIQNTNRSIVRLWDLWAKRKFNKGKDGANLLFVIAEQENEDAILYLNIGTKFEKLDNHAPHTLIAGTSGSGKSVLLRTLILDIAATNSSKDVKLLLIDPKAGAELDPFNCLPHMMMDTIVTKEDAIKQLELLVKEMDDRNDRFKEKRVQNILQYNSHLDEGEEKIPYIFVVHDEFAEWMMDKAEYKDIVKNTVSRLGVKARSAGIFLIFAAQRPDNTVFPIQLRDNMGNRLVLKVTNEATSYIATGVKKANCENLMGNGHMIARLNSEMILSQTPYIDDDEFKEALEAIKQDNS